MRKLLTQWQPEGDNSWQATLTCDFTLDTVFEIPIDRNFVGEFGAVVPVQYSVDNMVNKYKPTVQLGGSRPVVVPANSQVYYDIPPGTLYLRVIGQAPIAPDVVNSITVYIYGDSYNPKAIGGRI
jgi:hypothetical protein